MLLFIGCHVVILSYSTLVHLDLILYSLACFDKQRVRFDDCDALNILVEESVMDIVAGYMLVALELSALIFLLYKQI
jgi:hypothetical protein